MDYSQLTTPVIVYPWPKQYYKMRMTSPNPPVELDKMKRKQIYKTIHTIEKAGERVLKGVTLYTAVKILVSLTSYR